MIAFLFPGQGSQYRGMGQQLFDEVREFTSVEKSVDELLGYSMRKLCLEDPDNKLKQTQHTQPSLYVVNALYYYKALSQGAHPSYVAGHSLGEYNALLVAGVFDFLTGLRLVIKRGELMARMRNGAMAAVVGLDADQVARVLAENRLSGVDVANFNAPKQIVISGPVPDIQRSAPLFEEAGASMYMPLQVSAAFHSRYMSDVAQTFNEFIAPIPFSAARVPVIANVNAAPYPSDHSSAIKAGLADQIKSPVQWTRTIRFLLARGVTEFKEIGPGNVLTRLVQQIRQDAEPAAARELRTSGN